MVTLDGTSLGIVMICFVGITDLFSQQKINSLYLRQEVEVTFSDGNKRVNAMEIFI